MIEEILYLRLPGPLARVNEKLIKKCSDLYSNHYGVWSKNGIRPGERIKLSPRRISEWLIDDTTVIYYAQKNEEIIGYAIAMNKKEQGLGIVTWVTQLVVHTDYRNQGIAKNILFSIWGFSNHYAWGIVSANPFAIRALEKATRRRSIPVRIKKNHKKLMRIGRENIPFFDENTVIEINSSVSRVNTHFFVDHENNSEMIKKVISLEVPWTLGEIDDGWEWFAFTFNDQDPIQLSKDEISEMVNTSDRVVREAYSKMNLNPNVQAWMKGTKKEVEYIMIWSPKVLAMTPITSNY